MGVRKYFFFDIDGTITERISRKPVESAVEALHKLQEAGHFVAIATGRAHYKARPFMESVGLHDMVCCGGGALVINDQLISNQPLPLDKAKEVIAQAEELGYGILLQLDDSTKVYSKNDLFLKQVGERKEPTEYIFDESLDYDQLDQIFKIYVSIPKEEEHLLSTKDKVGHLRFIPEYLMFQYDEKHQGIQDMIEAVHGKIEDVVVFGDDTNDLVMFDPRWTSIAMGNACDLLKEKADYVTAKNVEDGIYKACEHFGWFEKV